MRFHTWLWKEYTQFGAPQSIQSTHAVWGMGNVLPIARVDMSSDGSAYLAIGTAGATANAKRASSMRIWIETYGARSVLLQNMGETLQRSASDMFEGQTGDVSSATSTTVVLAAGQGAASTNRYYEQEYITITAGTGAGQRRKITGYTGSTRTCTVSAWTLTPDGTSDYSITTGGFAPIYDNGILSAASAIQTVMDIFVAGSSAATIALVKDSVNFWQDNEEQSVNFHASSVPGLSYIQDLTDKGGAALTALTDIQNDLRGDLPSAVVNSQDAYHVASGNSLSYPAWGSVVHDRSVAAHHAAFSAALDASFGVNFGAGRSGWVGNYNTHIAGYFDPNNNGGFAPARPDSTWNTEWSSNPVLYNAGLTPAKFITHCEAMRDSAVQSRHVPWIRLPTTAAAALTADEYLHIFHNFGGDDIQVFDETFSSTIGADWLLTAAARYSEAPAPRKNNYGETRLKMKQRRTR